MAIEIDEPTIVETILHYGLLLGAVFQLICIFAVIFVPKSESETDNSSEESRNMANPTQQISQQNKQKKKEKKKHR